MTKTPDQITAALKQLKDSYIETARAEFKAGFAALFDQYPQLKSVSWTQYTPYFNDGEECSFSVHLDEPTINGFDPYDDDKDAANLYAQTDKESKACLKAVDDFLDAFDADVYEDLFDDHVEVTVTRKGIKTSEYQHD